jgi:hypothetical protein
MSILCKVLETMIRNSVVHHIEKNELFSIHQHGFIVFNKSVGDFGGIDRGTGGRVWAGCSVFGLPESI